MAKPSTLLCAIFVVLFLNVADVDCCPERTNCVGRECKKPSKLFVFGDSYADTGNLPNIGREVTRSWYYPYGFTFPKQPTGRFSNGKLLTDFVASMLGIPTPVTYKSRGFSPKRPYGMNFAVGGSGVFDAPYKQPTLAQQITSLEDLVSVGAFSECDLKDSVALVAISGNDYSGVSSRMDHNFTKIVAFISNVTKEMGEQVARLPKLGVPRVIINNMHPLGCTPYLARDSNYTGCDPTGDFGAYTHNDDLAGVVQKLQDPNNSTFLLLDLFQTFMSLVQPDDTQPKLFKHLLAPCCESFDPEGYCGQIDDSCGSKQYSLCSEPDNHFYWDSVHPTQSGWAAVTYLLSPTISEFLGF